jgi:nondiscriminating aspartyl-tRNA synthetase
MERIYSLDLTKHIGKEVKIAGFLFQKRFLGHINFIILRDKDGLIQIVIDKPSEIEKIRRIADESVLEIEGMCCEDERAPNKVEIRNPKIKILQEVQSDYVVPIEINKPFIHAHIDTLLDARPLVLRNPKERAIFKIQSTMAKAFREYCSIQGATEIFVPTITEVSAEGGSELFEIKYYNRKAYLAQSAQLYKQIMVGVFEKVFSIAHSYRAEKFGTSRHLTEFTQYEFEMGFIDNINDLINFGINVIKYIKEKIENENKNELNLLANPKENTLQLPQLPEIIPVIKFSDVKKMLSSKKSDKNDISPDEEREISKQIKSEYKSDLLVITHYPMSKRPFYTKSDPKNPEESLSFDFILNGEEILTGGERINDLSELTSAMKIKKMNLNDFESYLLAFKYGMPKEGGFGIGLERLTQQFLGFSNIREVTLFPRDVKRLTP